MHSEGTLFPNLICTVQTAKYHICVVIINAWSLTSYDVLFILVIILRTVLPGCFYEKEGWQYFMVHPCLQLGKLAIYFKLVYLHTDCTNIMQCDYAPFIF